MRPGTVLAIAERDLRSELKGRQGRGLVFITFALLLPAAILGRPDTGPELISVRGDVPAEVLALPGVERSQFGIGFRRVDGDLNLWTWRVPEPVRDVLDGREPAVIVEEVHPPARIPRRTLLLALVSASTLTAAVSTSIGGERAHHTLQALLSAAVTRLEIVLGKWLAWTAFGTFGALTASAAAILAGRQDPGEWLLAMPLVPGLTVALGLWIVRRTEDVIAGTTVSLRVMPAVLGGALLSAWMLSFWTDLGAALIPLGGAMLVAGDYWADQPLYTAVALTASVAVLAGLLFATARDLDERPARPALHRVRPQAALLDGAPIAGLWWALVPGPALWGWAGNAGQTELLGPTRGLVGGAVLLLVTTLVRFVRVTDRSQLPKAGTLHWSLLVGLVGVVGAGLLPVSTSPNPWIAEGAARLHLGLVPGPWLLLPVAFAQELWFRGWLQARAGWIPAALAWTVTVTPLDPAAGLLSGLTLGWAARQGVAPALVARLLGTLAVLLLA